MYGNTWDLLTPPPAPLGLLLEVQPRSCMSPRRRRRWLFQSFSARSKNLRTAGPRERRAEMASPLPGANRRQEAASRFQRAGKFGTALAKATIAVTFSGCEIQHQPWPRPFPFMEGQSSKVDVLLPPDVQCALLR